MRTHMLPVTLAVLGGIATAIQIPIYALIERSSSPLAPAFTAHAAGMLVAMAALATLAAIDGTWSPRE